MLKFVVYLIRIVNLYLYFVVGACFLALVPNINPAYPLFDYIFKIAGFYIIPPIFGVSFSPMCVLMVTALIYMGLNKIYDKYYKPKEPQIIIMSPEEFVQKVKEKEIKYKEDEISSSDNEDKKL